MDVRYDQIPAELSRLDRWVTWRYEKRNDKLTKPPYVPDQKKKRYALVNVPSTWGASTRQKPPCRPGDLTGSVLC